MSRPSRLESCAFSAALYTSPAIPAAIPVALDEQLVLGIATVIFEEKFVQPLKRRYDLGASVEAS